MRSFKESHIRSKKRPYTVLFVSDYPLCEVIGGSVKYLYEQSTLLAERGHEVHILTRQENLNEGYPAIDNVIEWKYPTKSQNALFFLRSTFSNSRKLFENLYKEFSYDVINFCQPLSAYGVMNSRICGGIKKIYTCHSLSFEEFQSRNTIPKTPLNYLQYKLQVILRKKIESKTLKKSDKIAVLSHYTKEKLRNIYKLPREKIQIIPGGVNTEKFTPSLDKKSIREKLCIPSDKIILFTIRNHVRRMGLDNLIIAFHEITKKFKDVYLVIGGEGPLRKGLVSLATDLGIGDSINFVGFIEEEILPEYYQMADLFVLPTKELEGFGLVTLEAMSSGLPVIGTPVGGTVEILDQFGSNSLFKGTDPGSLEALITEKYNLIRNHPKRWLEISMRSRQFIEDKYSWECNIDSLEKLFGTDLSK